MNKLNVNSDKAEALLVRESDLQMCFTLFLTRVTHSSKVQDRIQMHVFLGTACFYLHDGSLLVLLYSVLGSNDGLMILDYKSRKL